MIFSIADIIRCYRNLGCEVWVSFFLTAQEVCESLINVLLTKTEEK